MKKTMCELFAGVGGFRCGLERVHKWDTVWFNQWEPADKRVQYAHGCYVDHFGTCLDLSGNDTTNVNIELVDKSLIPDFNLLVGGFPCQDYSVANSLSTANGIEGKKGVLWWSIYDVLEKKRPPFVLLENVDRLLKSPAKQRGRDFGIILWCFHHAGYIVEWRVINAADYGCAQRRRRTFIFAYRIDTQYAKRMFGIPVSSTYILDIMKDFGFFAQTFSAKPFSEKYQQVQSFKLPDTIIETSDSFSCDFQNAGIMYDSFIYTTRMTPDYHGPYRFLGDILESNKIDPKYFVDKSRLYYTNPNVIKSDETRGRFDKSVTRTFQYIKGGKKIVRKRQDGSSYIYSEGSMPMIDEWDKPSRTLLTSEGNFSRMTHLVRDKVTGEIRYLTPLEMERLQGFPDDHTKYYLSGDTRMEMPMNKRRFMMGNALVVDLVVRMGKMLGDIFELE